MAYRLPPVLSRLSVPSCATRSTFPYRPYRLSVSSLAVRSTPPSHPYLFSRLVARRPSDVSKPPVHFFPLLRALSARLSVRPSGFPLRRPLLVRGHFPSVPSSVLSRMALFALTAISPGNTVNRQTRVRFNSFMLCMCLCTFVIVPN